MSSKWDSDIGAQLEIRLNQQEAKSTQMHLSLTAEQSYHSSKQAAEVYSDVRHEQTCNGVKFTFLSCTHVRIIFLQYKYI